MTFAEKVFAIKQEIKRLKQVNGFLPLNSYELCEAYRARGYQFACDDILQFVDSLPEEPVSEDLEEEIENWIKAKHFVFTEIDEVIETAKYFAEWQKQKDMQDFLEKAVKFLERHKRLSNIFFDEDFIPFFKEQMMED